MAKVKKIVQFTLPPVIFKVNLVVAFENVKLYFQPKINILITSRKGVKELKIDVPIKH